MQKSNIVFVTIEWDRYTNTEFSDTDFVAWTSAHWSSEKIFKTDWSIFKNVAAETDFCWSKNLHCFQQFSERNKKVSFSDINFMCEKLSKNWFLGTKCNYIITPFHKFSRIGNTDMSLARWRRKYNTKNAVLSELRSRTPWCIMYVNVNSVRKLITRF